MKPSMAMPKPVNKALIAVNRFGYGAAGEQLALATADTQAWLKAQLRLPQFSEHLSSSSKIMSDHFTFQMQQKKNKDKNTPRANSQDMFNNMQKSGEQNSKDKKIPKSYARKALVAMATDGIQQASVSDHSVSWRLFDFFSNHFSVSAQGRLMSGLAATLEREAIAHNLLGNFEDMLLAVIKHPAMLVYLNNERSFGENSKIGKRRGLGLNENLAREILELHTLGVDGGYQQNDVTELAMAITGWSIKQPKRDVGVGFFYREEGHEPGSRRIMGVKFSQQGLEQGEVVLKFLANHPSTANFVCRKLVNHFIGPTVSAEIVTELSSVWLKTNGNIEQVMLSLFEQETLWAIPNQKFKSPRDFVISAVRAIEPEEYPHKALYNAMSVLGQKPFNAGSPAGFSDDNADWLGANAMMTRIDWVSMVAARYKNKDPIKIMAKAFGENVSERTYNMVARAQTRQEGLALLLLSPEFQWR